MIEDLWLNFGHMCVASVWYTVQHNGCFLFLYVYGKHDNDYLRSGWLLDLGFSQ